MNICSCIDMNNENVDLLMEQSQVEPSQVGSSRVKPFQVRLSQLDSSQFEEAAYLLRSLANEVRLRLATTLAQVGRCLSPSYRSRPVASNRFFRITLPVCGHEGSFRADEAARTGSILSGIHV